jgi:hypothetical protein
MTYTIQFENKETNQLFWLTVHLVEDVVIPPTTEGDE